MKRWIRFALIVAAAMFANAANAQYSTPYRNVDNPDRFPYQQYASITIFPPNLTGFATVGGFAAGKRTVIEFSSISCNSDSVNDAIQQALIDVANPSAPVAETQWPPLVRTGTGGSGGGTIASSAGPMKLYVEEGGNLQLIVNHVVGTATVRCTVFFSGHTVTP